MDVCLFNRRYAGMQDATTAHTAIGNALLLLLRYKRKGGHRECIVGGVPAAQTCVSFVLTSYWIHTTFIIQFDTYTSVGMGLTEIWRLGGTNTNEKFKLIKGKVRWH